MFGKFLNYIKLFYYLLRPNTIFLRWTSHALGDNILLTMLLADLRKNNFNSQIIVETKYPELFDNNPYTDWVTNLHFRTTKKFIKPKYFINSNTNTSLQEQMIRNICRYTGQVPTIFLSDEEINKVEFENIKPIIVIAPTGKTKFSANRKEWGFNNFQRLVDLLKDFNVIQIGMPEDPLLQNVTDCRIIDIRKTAAILLNAKLFVGLEGGFMHLSRSVNTPAVIIYGGYIRPEISGYEINTNIYTAPSCSPCYQSNTRQKDCLHMTCMNTISVEKVYNEILIKLQENT